MTEPQSFLDGKVLLHAGDCAAIIRTLADNSIDSVCTDPPYSLVSIVKRFGKDTLKSNMEGKTWVNPKALQYKRLSAGFMGKEWDNGAVAFDPEFWREIIRVLRPGGHVAAFGGTRTFHRLACAIEDAGFEIRDSLFYIYGSGFPKSRDISKAIDKEAGVEREVIGERKLTGTARKSSSHAGHGAGAVNACDPREYVETFQKITAPATDAAREWAGWGSALKPSVEPICLARKPLSEPTIAANVLRWGCGGLNIDATRISPSFQEDVSPSFARLSQLRALSEKGVASRELVLGVLSHIVSALRSCNNFGIDRSRSEGVLGGNSPADDQADRKLLSLLLPNVVLCDLNWKEVLNSQGDCLVCRRFCGEQLRHLQAASQVSGASLADALAHTCSSLQEFERSHDCQSTDRLYNSFASFFLGAALDKYGAYLSRRNSNSRWPANILHDNSPEVLAAFPDSGGGAFSQSGHRDGGKSENCVGLNGIKYAPDNFGDSGSAARFFASFPQEESQRLFYSSKADADDRLGSRHPTVKPVSLISWLVRLITPPGGTILDPFSGTGTTAEAAYREGFRAVLCEREPEYQADIARRMALMLSGPDTRKHASIKARGLTADAGPLFGGLDEPIGGGRQIYGVFADENGRRKNNRADRNEEIA